MANTLYDSAITNFGNGNIRWISNTIAVYLMGGTSANPTNDAFVTVQDLINSGATYVASGAIGSKTLSNRNFGGANVTIPSVTGADVTFAILCQTSAAFNNSLLICNLDNTTSASALPYTPTGVDVTVSFSEGPTKIFSL